MANFNPFPTPKKPTSEMLKKAFTYLQDGTNSVKSFLELFNNSRGARAGGGPATKTEQDLLRAMIVFAGATIDVVLKETIRSCLFSLSESNKEIYNEVEKLINRKVADETKGREILVSLMLSENPRSAATSLVAESLIGGSLQSRQELQKIFELLKLNHGNNDWQKINDALLVRNKIVHELDAEPKSSQARLWTRVRRSRDDMIDHTKRLLDITQTFLIQVDSKLK